MEKQEALQLAENIKYFPNNSEFKGVGVNEAIAILKNELSTIDFNWLTGIEALKVLEENG